MPTPVVKVSNSRKTVWFLTFCFCVDIKIFLGDDEEEENEVIDEDVDDYNED